MKKCPYCAEEIQSKAIKCKHCGEMVTNTKPKTTKTTNTKTGAGGTSKIKAVFYILGTLLFIGGLADLSNGFGGENILTGLSIVFACMSHTGLIARLNGNPRPILEYVPLALLGVIVLIALSLPQGMIEENPQILLPSIIYIIMYLVKKSGRK